MNNGLKNYGLCLGHYFGRETLNWDLNYISQGYSKANKKYLRSFNPNQELKQIYTQIETIYAVILCLSFFQQVHLNGYTKELGSNEYTKESSKGCIFDVDIEYPK